MEPRRVIFVSAVTNEFHKKPQQSPRSFASYRDVLKQAFRFLAPEYEVIVQEDLQQGFGDLLETLDHEISRSLFFIHLVGDLAGFEPPPAVLRHLHSRHTDFLSDSPELRTAVGDGRGITYTQWEIYLAFHHGIGRLIFEAQPSDGQAREVSGSKLHDPPFPSAGAAADINPSLPPSPILLPGFLDPSDRSSPHPEGDSDTRSD